MAESSDAEIEAMLIGGPTVHDDVIRLADYDEAWVGLFEREAARIRGVLGSGALAVELRVDADDRALYERTKRQLAARRWQYVQHYANAKSDVVGEIVARALARAGDR